MKTYIITLVWLTTVNFLFAQEENNSIKKVNGSKIADLSIENAVTATTSPALSLLDISTTTIETIDLTKKLDIQSLNFGNNSVEFFPFRFNYNPKRKNSDKRKELGYKFDYIKENGVKTKNLYLKKGPFYNLTNSVSFSVANTYTDSLSSVALGFRANLISLYPKQKYFEELDEYYADRNDYVTEHLGKTRNEFRGSCKYLDIDEKIDEKVACIDSLLSKDKNLTNIKIDIESVDNEINGNKKDKYKKALMQLDSDLEKFFLNKYEEDHKDERDTIDYDADRLFKPYFTIDLASAYSFNFLDNKIDESRGSRFGLWLTEKYVFNQNNNTKIEVYGVQRYINDDAVWDSDTQSFTNEEYFDLGGKFELVWEKYSAGVEYINRFGDNEDYRFVGNVSRKINKNTSLIAGFGKNFEEPDGQDFISLLGIKWGISNQEPKKE